MKQIISDGKGKPLRASCSFDSVLDMGIYMDIHSVDDINTQQNKQTYFYMP